MGRMTGYPDPYQHQHQETQPMSDQIRYQTTAKPINPLNALTVRVTDQLVIFERGKLSTSTQQIPLVFVQDVDATQSMTQKARGVGTVVVHVLRPTGPERVQLDDLPDFQILHACINDLSGRARTAAQRARQTHHYTGGGPGHQPSAPQPPAPQRPARSDRDDALDQLERLGRLRDSGVITSEEFEAKKAGLLDRL